MPNHGLERLSVRRYSRFFDSRNYQDHTACLFRGVPAAADNAEDRVSDLLGFLNGRHQVCADITSYDFFGSMRLEQRASHFVPFAAGSPARHFRQGEA